LQTIVVYYKQRSNRIRSGQLLHKGELPKPTVLIPLTYISHHCGVLCTLTGRVVRGTAGILFIILLIFHSYTIVILLATF